MSYETNTFFRSGSWNVHCDVCGFRFKATDIKKRWDGLMVCHNDWEMDHPQKYIRVNEDRQTVPFVRKQNDDTFVEVCYVWAKSGYVGLGTVGCAQVGNNALSYTFLYDSKNAHFGA